MSEGEAAHGEKNEIRRESTADRRALIDK